MSDNKGINNILNFISITLHKATILKPSRIQVNVDVYNVPDDLRIKISKLIVEFTEDIKNLQAENKE